MLVQPGWHAVVPCQRRIPFIYLALEAGELDVPVTLPGPKHRSRKTLRDLAAIPLDQQGPVFAEMHQHVAARHAFQEEGWRCLPPGSAEAHRHACYLHVCPMCNASNLCLEAMGAISISLVCSMLGLSLMQTGSLSGPPVAL